MERKKRISFEIEHFHTEGVWIVRHKENGVCTLAPRELTLIDALAWIDDVLEKGDYTEQDKVKVDIILRRTRQ